MPVKLDIGRKADGWRSNENTEAWPWLCLSGWIWIGRNRLAMVREAKSVLKRANESTVKAVLPHVDLLRHLGIIKALRVDDPVPLPGDFLTFISSWSVVLTSDFVFGTWFNARELNSRPSRYRFAFHRNQCGGQ